MVSRLLPTKMIRSIIIYMYTNTYVVVYRCSDNHALVRTFQKQKQTKKKRFLLSTTHNKESLYSLVLASFPHWRRPGHRHLHHRQRAIVEYTVVPVLDIPVRTSTTFLWTTPTQLINRRGAELGGT